MPSLELLTRTELNPLPSAPAVAGVPAPAPAGANAGGPQFGNVLASTIDSARSPAQPAADAPPPAQGSPAPAAPAEQPRQPAADSPASSQPDSASQSDAPVDTALAAELAAAASLPPAPVVPDRDVADESAGQVAQMPLAGCGAPPQQLASLLAQTDLSQTRAADPVTDAGAASDLASAPAAVSTAVFAPASLIAGLVQPAPDSESAAPAAPSGTATKSAAASAVASSNPATIEAPVIHAASGVLPALASAAPVPRATSATTAPASTDETAPSAPSSAPAAASASSQSADAVIAALAPKSDVPGTDSGAPAFSTVFSSAAAPAEGSPSSVSAQSDLAASAAGSASLIAGNSATNLLQNGDGAAGAGPATGPGAAHAAGDADPANPSSPSGLPNPEAPALGAAPQSLQLQGTTVAAQQTTAAPAHSQGVVNQVAYAIQYSHDSGQGMQLHLTPPELGSVQVDVSVRDGVLSARLEAQSAATRQILTDNLTALKESLTQQGVTFDRIDVGLAGSHTGSESAGSAFASLAQQQEGALPWDQQYPEAGAEEASVVPQPNLRTARAPLTALDIMV